MAQLYGNAAGGVVQVFTEEDATVPTASLSTDPTRDTQISVVLNALDQPVSLDPWD